MFVNFSEEVRHILKQAQREKEELNHPYIGSEHLFLSVLKESKLIPFFKKYGLNYNKFKNKLISLVGIGSKASYYTLYTPLLKRALENSVIEAREEKNKNVTIEMIVLSILDEADGVASTILNALNININKIYIELKNKKVIKGLKRKKLMLEEIGTDITKLAKEKKLDPVIGRNIEIQKTIEILLRRKKNNPILIGPAGVGKTAIVEGIANLIAFKKAPEYLKDKKIISLNIFSLVSGTKYRGEFEEKMKILIKELEENPDIILFLDEIHTIVGAGGAEGAIDASNIFKPALARGSVRIIGATTFDEYKKFIEPDEALARRFQSVLVEEPSLDNVIKILYGIKPLYEKYHHIKVPNDLVKDIAILSNKYLSNRYEPDRSIDILDEVCASCSITKTKDDKLIDNYRNRLKNIIKAKTKALKDNDFKNAYTLSKQEKSLNEKIKNKKLSNKIITKKDIIEIIKRKGNITFFNMDSKRKEFYYDLKQYLKDIIIGQDDKIDNLIFSLRKKELLKSNRCYSVLIKGDKSTGKTLLARSYLKKLVNEKNIIEIDASLYVDNHFISKLIGTSAGYIGYDNKNNIFEKIRTNPNSAIIIDNFDKGCVEFKDLFYRILKNGKIEEASSKLIDFNNTMLVFINDNLNEYKNVGFNSKLSDNNKDSELEKLVSTSICLTKPDEKNTKKIIKNSINKIIDSFSSIKITYDEAIIEYIYKKISNDTGFSNLKLILDDLFLKKITDSVFENKTKVNITLGTIKI